MPKIITKKFTIYDLEDLKSDDELCDKIYQKFWLDNPDNINGWVDDNLDSFKKFADTLHMGFDCSLSNGECPERSCYVKLTPDYSLVNKDYKELLKDYKGNGYYLCFDLKIFTLNLLDKNEYQVLYEKSIDGFVEKIQNKMFKLWFKDNEYYYCKESFLDYVDANNYKFDEDGNFIINI